VEVSDPEIQKEVGVDLDSQHPFAKQGSAAVGKAIHHLQRCPTLQAQNDDEERRPARTGPHCGTELWSD
jgi:hypothetical protein